MKDRTCVICCVQLIGICISIMFFHKYVGYMSHAFVVVERLHLVFTHSIVFFVCKFSIVSCIIIIV